MKHTDLANIQEVVLENHLVSDRIKKLRKMGYTVDIRRMGSGGVMQIKRLKNETRIQVSYGYGKYNYAYVVIIKNN